MRILRKICRVLSQSNLLGLGLIAAVSLTANQSWAQPANDSFANAQILNGTSGSVTSSNFLATVEPSEPDILGIPGGASVWFSWSPAADGTVTFSTFGSDFDTMIG